MINEFSGCYHFLSNFYVHNVFYKGPYFPSSEHAYQAMKHPHAILQPFLDPATTPAKAKHPGDQELVEGNEWGDVFWGVCKGVGDNHLGKLLMEFRERVKKDESVII